MSCSCDQKCATRAKMRERHGTPEQFEAAVLRAWDMVTEEEARAAISRYRLEYARAPEGS